MKQKWRRERVCGLLLVVGLAGRAGAERLVPLGDFFGGDAVLQGRAG